MSMIQRAGLALGVLCLLGAAAMTFIPTSPEGATCGNWVNREWDDEAVDDLVENGADLYEQDFTGEFGPEALGLAAGARHNQRICDDALNQRRTFTFILLGLGIVLPVAMLFVGGGPRRSRPTGAASAPPPPGWYPAPDQQGLLRWWDGRSWTEHTGPAQGTTERDPGGSAPWGR